MKARPILPHATSTNEAKMSNSSSVDSVTRNGFASRYGISASDVSPANEVIDSLLSHRSVRAYSDKPVSDAAIEQIIAAAQSASSSSNLQLWSVISVQDPARRSRLSALAGGQKHVESAPIFLVWLADLSRADRVGRARGASMEGIAYTESCFTSVVDTALAAQNAVSAAESLGLGAVYIGAMRNRPQEVARELGLPPLTMAAFGMCLGWPDPAQPTGVKPRLPQSAVLHKEQYDSANEGASVAAYDEAMKAFQAAQQMAMSGWSAVQTARLRDAAALDGRDTLRAAIHELGFELR